MKQFAFLCARFTLTSIVLLLAWAAIAGSVLLFAQSVHAREVNAMANACRSDYLALCPKVQPGEGRVADCLKQHAAELSSLCKAQLDNISQCSEQVKSICGAAGTDKSALRSCMKAHASAFSATCRAS